MVLPEMIMAMALLVVLLSLGVKLSLFTVILGHVLVCTPFAMAILTSRLPVAGQVAGRGGL